MRITFLNIFFLISSISWAQKPVFDASPLNSQADEQLPVLAVDGRYMFFTRGHHPGNTGGRKDKGDIYFSQLTDSGWVAPVRLGPPLNNSYNNGVVDYKGGLLWLYDEYRSSFPLPGLSVAEVNDFPDKISEPKKVAIKYFKNASANRGMMLSADGKILVMAIESYKTRGAEDLYVSFWQSDANTWSEPLNLGGNINTPLQELTPYLAPDNATLFFASNGHGGFGSRDIFVSQRLDDSWTHWSEPQNLGEGINTEGAEMGYRYYPSLELAVYTTTKDSDGYGDIRIVEVKKDEMNTLLDQEIPEPIALAEVPEPQSEPAVEQVEEDVKPVPVEGKVLLKGRIVDAKTGEPVLGRAKVILAGGEMLEHYNDSVFSFQLDPTAQFALQVDAEGYISQNINFTSRGPGQEMVENVRLDAIEVGTTVKLNNVLFVRSKSELLPASYDQLNLVAEMMLNNPSMIIELAGHTDNVGVAAVNLRLSQQRVDAVIEYLVEKGIDKSRLSGKGYGGSRPIASNATEATRRLNRRVEFTILKQ